MTICNIKYGINVAKIFIIPRMVFDMFMFIYACFEKRDKFYTPN